ncbi:MAG: Clp protease ClpP [Selenomonadaceae bacterium]|nr:Clp protease ClpP [Selenomonadaceae bacterium]
MPDKYPKGHTTFWKFRNEAESETAELMLYGEISDVSWYGDEVTPKQFHEDLVSCEGKNLAVHINSPGGDVFAAQAIYTQLKAYTGRVTMHIDGMCASAATIIACAGDTVIMPSNTIYMIHNPKSAMLGYFDAPQLDKIAASLGAVKQTIVNVYMARVQGALSEVQLKHKMDSEEWMTAETAKSYGFVDEITEAIPIENKWEGDALFVNSVSCRLDRFQNAAKLREILNGTNSKRSEFSMTDNEILQKIKNVLGLGGTSPASQQTETPPMPPLVPAAKNHAEDKAAILAEERQRIQALDAMKNGNPAVDAIIETAKGNGATAESIKPYVDAIGQGQSTAQTAGEDKMLAAIKAILTDNAESGAAGVLPTPQDGAKNEAAEKAANIEEVAGYANKLMGVK